MPILVLVLTWLSTSEVLNFLATNRHGYKSRMFDRYRLTLWCVCQWAKTKIVVISNIRSKLCFGNQLLLMHHLTWNSKWLDFTIFDQQNFPALSPNNVFSKVTNSHHNTAHFKRNWNMVRASKSQCHPQQENLCNFNLLGWN